MVKLSDCQIFRLSDCQDKPLSLPLGSCRDLLGPSRPLLKPNGDGESVLSDPVQCFTIVEKPSQTMQCCNILVKPRQRLHSIACDDERKSV